MKLTLLKQYFLVALLLISIPAFSRKTGINKALKASLDSIGVEDQRYRILREDLTEQKRDSLSALYKIKGDSVYAYLSRLQDAIDMFCSGEVERIIKKYGYPGKELVGTPTNTVAFYVIQHSDKIPVYFPLLKEAGLKGELQFDLVAMMEDRLLTEQGKEQIYGTQLWGNKLIKDSLTGILKPDYYFYPIKDIATVNERRKKAGFTTTIEEYAVEMEVQFRVKKPDWWK